MESGAGEAMRIRREDREKRRKKLDEEQRPYRAALQKAAARAGWLREIRVALDIPVPELVGKLKINRSEVFRIEKRETRGRIALETLERMAEALDCRLIYAVVPKKGTFADLSLKRAWDGLFGPDGKKNFRQMMRYAANRWR